MPLARRLSRTRSVISTNSLRCRVLTWKVSTGHSLSIKAAFPDYPTRPATTYNNYMDRAEIIIVGGGVIGLTTAYFLAREGAEVLLLDKGDLGREASWAGAGILPPGNPAAARTPFDR